MTELSATRQGMTFNEVLMQCVQLPEFYMQAMRLAGGHINEAPPPTKCAIDALIDQSVSLGPEAVREVLENGQRFAAVVFLTVWTRLEPLPSENTAEHDARLERSFAGLFPELFGSEK